MLTDKICQNRNERGTKQSDKKVLYFLFAESDYIFFFNSYSVRNIEPFFFHSLFLSYENAEPEIFIENIINHNANTRNLKIHSYYDLWRKAIKSVVFPVFEYSSIYIAQLLASVIPENSVLHLAILSSTRVMQFFPLKTGVKTYSNIGALGIDGCLSSFIGQACSSSNLAFCLIGDLSFFYDMNAVSIKHLKKNARIILLNNGGATEFHLMMGRDKIPSINKYIAVDNKRIAKGWIESLGLTYYSVQNAEDAEKIIPMLAQQSDRPVFVEVFTDKEKDAQIIKEFYNENYPITLKSTVKTVAEKVLPDKQYDQLIGIYKKIINDIVPWREVNDMEKQNT